MFCDTSYHTMDAKHRVFVPKRFQQELTRDADGNVVAVVTPGLGKCLFLFSSQGFDEVRSRLYTQAFGGGEQLRDVQRRFFSSTVVLQLDASGRILIPEALRKRAGLEKEVAMVGVADRAEIWAKERWEAFLAEGEDDLEQLDAVLCAPLSRNGGDGTGA